MTTGFFKDATAAKYEGPDSSNPLAFRYYNADEIVMGKRMEDHLRFACAYWHSFCWPGGDPYVLWGGREGYETLLNTNMGQELDQLGRFLNLVVEYKHKIGFKGTILIEPKPQEPTKHQYDYDVATVYGFLKRYGLEDEVKLNIEQGHAILAGHSFEHELATANALGVFGSIDMNRNDYQSGWDTDQFPNNVPEMALAYYHILQGGGFTSGGTNFDSKLRRMIQEGTLPGFVDDRYQGWSETEAQKMLSGGYSLSDIEGYVRKGDVNPEPVSGRQEYLENVVNRFV